MIKQKSDPLLGVREYGGVIIRFITYYAACTKLASLRKNSGSSSNFSIYLARTKLSQHVGIGANALERFMGVLDLS